MVSAFVLFMGVQLIVRPASVAGGLVGETGDPDSLRIGQVGNLRAAAADDDSLTATRARARAQSCGAPASIRAWRP